MKEWKKERCASKPDELQLIAPDLYMERKNIVEVEHEGVEGEDPYTDWECDSREITVSEYEMLKSIEGINTQDAIDAYTEQLIEGGIL